VLMIAAALASKSAADYCFSTLSQEPLQHRLWAIRPMISWRNSASGARRDDLIAGSDLRGRGAGSNIFALSIVAFAAACSATTSASPSGLGGRRAGPAVQVNTVLTEEGMDKAENFFDARR